MCCVSCSVVSDSLRPHGLYRTRLLLPWNSLCKNVGVGCHSLLQRIFLTQGLNLGLLLVAQTVKNMPSMQKTQVLSWSWEDLLEKGMVTHSNILTWRIPWTEEPGRLQSMGSKELEMTEQLTLSPALAGRVFTAETPEKPLG